MLQAVDFAGNPIKPSFNTGMCAFSRCMTDKNQQAFLCSSFRNKTREGLWHPSSHTKPHCPPLQWHCKLLGVGVPVPMKPQQDLAFSLEAPGVPPPLGPNKPAELWLDDEELLM